MKAELELLRAQLAQARERNVSPMLCMLSVTQVAMCLLNSHAGVPPNNAPHHTARHCGNSQRGEPEASNGA